MLRDKSKRLAELERGLAATREQATGRLLDAIWTQFNAEELTAIEASLQRQLQPGYVLTAEDKALEQRWAEAVQVAVPEADLAAATWQEWAVQWCEAIRKHG